MKFSVAAFGDWLDPKITRQRVNQLVNRGDLLRGADKKIDTEHPVNAAWLKSREGIEHQPKPTNTKRAAGAAPPPPPPPASLDSLEDVLDNLQNLDFDKLTKASVDKIKAIESAMKTRVEREEKRKLLINRSLVRSVFSRLYQIEVNETQQLGAAIASEIAGMLGEEDPEKVLLVEKAISDKVMRTRQHIKRVMNDALVAWGGEGL